MVQSAPAKAQDLRDIRDVVPSLGQQDPLEEGMATHCYIFAQRISWTGETGGLPSIGSQRVRQDSSDLAHMHTGFFGDLPQWFSKTCAKLSQIALTVRLQGQGQVSPHS